MAGPADTSLTVSLAVTGGRVTALDALRGLAVAGIALMNVIAFSMPAAAYVNPRSFGGTGPLESALWALVFVVVEDKFRALFAMLFGAGVAILLGREGPHRLAGHYSRMAVLFAIGFAHALLLANNDILRVYAVAGLLLPFAVRLHVRTLFWLAAAIIAAQLAVSGYVAWGWLDYWYRFVTGVVSDPGPLLPAEQRFGADPQVIAAGLAQGAETFGQRMDRRFDDLLGPIAAVMSGLPSSLAAMLVGIGLWKNGLLAGEWEHDRLMRLFRRMAVIALPALALMAWISFASGFDAVVTASNGLVWSAPFDLLLAIGWAALAMASFRRGGALTWLWAQAGRMALTNYLLTSFVFSMLFASWGLGMFGKVDRVEAYVLCSLPISLMLILSPLWLSVFRQGPAEWLWRSIAGLHLLPFRR
ncbi:DUF418 domain-containing protein [Alteraurantiacibacter aestuarii]|uniref:DUF418 domain-containing protein n=1 Tax=Alteraurantiacibacter aestuarii TaxID=650004 RepID=A0A844ZJ60_9SPHN|nr:DUF418 domain-containing protein [Alteraurantiacibacter aestuarii]MXO87186.1 DUF418 domain-containing protein [Alteraurantiacibacter aestuarii]